MDTTSGVVPSGSRSRAQHTFGPVGENLFPSSPDGKTLIFASSRQGPRFAIVKKPLGEALLTLVTGGSWNDIQPSISPDGKLLAFSSDREGSWDIHLQENQPGAQAKRLTGSSGSSSSSGDAFAPSWAPDSRRLAFFRRNEGSGNWEVWIADVQKGTEQYLCPGLFPAWSPETPGGEWIAYQQARERDGSWYSIWKIRPDGSSPTELIQNGNWGAVHPSWSPGGGWIAFAAIGKDNGPGALKEASGIRPADGDIYLITSGGARLTNLTGDRSGISEWNPCFGPDGRVYFNSDQDGSINIWSMDPGLEKNELKADR